MRDLVEWARHGSKQQEWLVDLWMDGWNHISVRFRAPQADRHVVTASKHALRPYYGPPPSGLADATFE